ncbi:translin associated protein x [Plakobranchus ocellatus]|uniref:Translin associated protein x n=1 Tax=Plakobranchus ocellatus TaxID=259542 RepID=A0AAV4A0C4_9GAST|nr:translin associated protein x [Plakobranchus ocellatus]
MASKQGGSGRGRGRCRKQNRSGYHSPKEKDNKSTEQLDETSPVVQAFRIFQRELDSRNDRNERIVKLSRDITIESKRIIFLLQRCAGGSAEILGFGSEEEFPRFPRFRWLPRLQLNKRAMIRGVLRNENSTTCGQDDNFIDLR